ncbi:MAG: putative toxin-antitoxin system toxin component, PIN family [Deltaproteobacteria bacterium]|nr:putative toxin-antitoxin system toxin component, PIN family [Deltaproteobacteria bacterium]
MIKVVLDTNVLTSAILFGGKPRRILELAFRGEIQVCVSEPILEELKGVLRRPRFDFSAEVVQTILAELIGLADFVYPSQRIEVVAEDPDDNRILECALEAWADYIITGDSHLLNLMSFKDILIVAPDKLLEKLR